MSAIRTRLGRRLSVRWSALAAFGAVFVLGGLGLMTSPANATEGNTGSVDTSVSAVYANPGVFTDKGNGGGDDQCAGDKCEKKNWCDGRGYDPHPGKITDDAPVVLTQGDKGKGGGKRDCVKRPKIDYKCCAIDEDGTTNNDITVTNRADEAFKVAVWLDNDEPLVKWVGAGESVVFRFKEVFTGEHKVHAAVWAGGKVWCKFATKKIYVKCLLPTTPPTTRPTTPPTTTPTSTPPTSGSPSPTPSEATPTATAPVPGGGGGDNGGPALPVTGPPIGWIAAAGGVLLAAGAAAMIFTRRRFGA